MVHTPIIRSRMTYQLDAWKIKIFIEFCIYFEPKHLDLIDIKGLICFYEECLIIAQYLGNISTIVQWLALMKLGELYIEIGCFIEALDFFHKAIETAKKKGYMEALALSNAGVVLNTLNKYREAILYLKKSLQSFTDNGKYDILEGKTYLNLGIAYTSLGKYQMAMEYCEKSLKIASEIGDRKTEADSYGKLGNIYQSLGKYQEAIEYLEQSLNIYVEIGDKSGEGTTYNNLGNVYRLLDKYQEAIEYLEKGLNIALEVGYKRGEGTTYTNLGIAYLSLGKYQKAIEYYEKSLNISINIADKSGEGIIYSNLAVVYYTLGKCDKAIENGEKSLIIAREIGDRSKEGASYLNLGCFYSSTRKYQEAEEYYEKSLKIAIEIGDKRLEGQIYCTLVNSYQSLGKYQEAIEYCEKSLKISKEIGHKRVEAQIYLNFGDVFKSMDKHDDAIEFYTKSLRIATEIGDKQHEAQTLSRVGRFYYLNYNKESLKNDKKNRELSINYLKKALVCWEFLFEHLHDEDDCKISIVDEFIDDYKQLTTVLIETKQLEEALLISNRGRARALGDLLMLKYTVDRRHASSSKPLEYPDVTKVLLNDNICILFFTVGFKELDIWVLENQKPMFFVKNENTRFVKELQCEEDQKEDMTKILHNVIDKSFNRMKVRMVECENRSLESNENTSFKRDVDEGVQRKASSVERNLTPDEEPQDCSQHKGEPLEILFNVLVAPVLENIEQEDIVIIPDGPLYTVPFAALRNPNTGLFLSETKSIRLAPSLTTLKTLQECPADCHSKTGALIVGDPDVGKVMFQGEQKLFSRLPSAKREAEILKRVLNAKPLIGSQATKEMVKQKLKEGVAIIHIAAHGSSENGHIALAPLPRTDGTSIPKEQDYMLTMQEVQEIGVRAQLVVLSCCHSGRGEIRSEGVVGMSRAFLAAGARAVVASLWAVDDDATLSFMVSFYTHLKMGESASKSLQQAMKELREEGYNEPRHWAPFFLIGDDVSVYKK